MGNLSKHTLCADWPAQLLHSSLDCWRRRESLPAPKQLIGLDFYEQCHLELYFYCLRYTELVIFSDKHIVLNCPVHLCNCFIIFMHCFLALSRQPYSISFLQFIFNNKFDKKSCLYYRGTTGYQIRTVCL